MITLKALFGGIEKTITISDTSGAGGDTLQLMINNYYQGIFIKNGGVWRWMPQNRDRDSLTSDDIQILIDLIHENEWK